MTTLPTSELELRKGILLALRGELDAAAEALELSRRLDPDAVDPVLNLFETYQKLGRASEAAALEEELLRRWGEDQAVLVAAAQYREEQGRSADALDLVRSRFVDPSETSLAYPHYLRLLLANGRFEEAFLEARRGFNSLYRPDALLATALGRLHFGEMAQANETLASFDPNEFADLLRAWGRRLQRSNVADRLRALVHQNLQQFPDDGRWLAVLAALTDQV